MVLHANKHRRRRRSSTTLLRQPNMSKPTSYKENAPKALMDERVHQVKAYNLTLIGRTEFGMTTEADSIAAAARRTLAAVQNDPAAMRKGSEACAADRARYDKESKLYEKTGRSRPAADTQVIKTAGCWGMPCSMRGGTTRTPIRAVRAHSALCKQPNPLCVAVQLWHMCSRQCSMACCWNCTYLPQVCAVLHAGPVIQLKASCSC
jgi:hypothetical protein